MPNEKKEGSLGIDTTLTVKFSVTCSSQPHAPMSQTAVYLDPAAFQKSMEKKMESMIDRGRFLQRSVKTLNEKLVSRSRPNVGGMSFREANRVALKKLTRQ